MAAPGTGNAAESRASAGWARRAWVGAAVALALVGVVWAASWCDLYPENFGVVAEGVAYRSADLTPAALRRVQERYGVKTIVDLGAYEPGSREEATAARTAAALGMTRRVFRLEGDGTGNPNAYVAALRVLGDPASRPVLVHCAAGAQRTGGCVMLYRHFFEGVSLDDGYSEARRYRHTPSRNPRLKPFIDQWAGPIETALKTGSHVPGFEAVDAGGAAVLPSARGAVGARAGATADGKR